MKVAELFEHIYEQPYYKDGSFMSSGLGLKFLHGCPEEVERAFYCSNNKLTSLKGGPKTVGEDYYCSDNLLTSLEYAPKTVGGEFECDNNSITSLHNIHKIFDSNGGTLDTGNNPIKECILGLLKIKKLKKVYMSLRLGKVEDIINKYLPEGNIIECQSELIEAGFEEFAKL
jgi:hypothetical protein